MKTIPRDMRPSLVPCSQDKIWSPLVAIFIAFASITLLSVIVSMAMGMIAPTSTSSAGFHIEKIVLLLVPLTLAALICRQRMSADNLGLVRPGIVRFLVWAVGGFIVLNVASEIFNRANNLPATKLEDYGFGPDMWANVLAALTVTAVAPAAEEIIFRGIFQRGARDFSRRFLPSWAAVAVGTAVSTWFFVSIHQSPEQSAMWPMYVVYGLVTALAYEMTGSLYAAIFVHAATNAFSVLLGVFRGDDLGIPAIIVTALAPVISCAIVWALGKLLPKRREVAAA